MGCPRVALVRVRGPAPRCRVHPGRSGWPLCLLLFPIWSLAGTSALWAPALTPCPGGRATGSLYPGLPGQHPLWLTDHPVPRRRRPPDARPCQGGGHPAPRSGPWVGLRQPRPFGHCGLEAWLPPAPPGQPSRLPAPVLALLAMGVPRCLLGLAAPGRTAGHRDCCRVYSGRMPRAVAEGPTRSCSSPQGLLCWDSE